MKVGLRYFGEDSFKDVTVTESDVSNVRITVDGKGLFVMTEHGEYPEKVFEDLKSKALAVEEGVGLERYIVVVPRKDFVELTGVPMPSWSLPEEPVVLIACLCRKQGKLMFKLYEISVNFE